MDLALWDASQRDRPGPAAAVRRLASLVLIALVVDLVYTTGATVLTSWRLASELRGAAQALSRLDLEEAAAHARSASQWGSYGETLGARPSAMAMRLLPFVGDEIEVLDELAHAAASVARDASSMTTDFDEVTAGASLSEVLIDDGRVEVATVDRLGEILGGHLPSLRSGLRRLSEATDRSLVLSSLADDVRSRTAHLTGSLVQGRDALRLMPAILGASTPRRYLLVFRSPSEARGGGGLPGLVGVLAARDGSLEIDGLQAGRSLLEGIRVPDLLLTSPLARAYGRSVVEDWRNVNMSPNFDATARLMLDLYGRASGDSLDGVVAMDPILLAHLAPAIGAVRGDGWDVEITSDNARRVLLHDVYRHFNGAEHKQNAYFASLVEDVWARVVDSQTDAVLLLEQLGEAAAKQHLQVYMRRRAENAVASAAGAGSASHRSPGTQVVFHNNWGANKIDFFLRRRIDTKIALSGSNAEVVTRVSLHNDIPRKELTGPPTVITKPAFGRRRELGTNRMTLHILLPDGAQVREVRVDGVSVPPSLTRDGGRFVASEFLEIPPGAAAEVEIRYAWKRALDREIDLTMVPQATVRPDTYSVALVDEGGRLVRPLRGDPAGRLKTPTRLRWVLP